MSTTGIIHKKWFTWSLVFAVYTLIAIFAAAQSIIAYTYADARVNYGLIINWNLTDWYLWALFTPLIYWFVSRFAGIDNSLKKIFLINIPVCAIFTVAYNLLREQAYLINNYIPNALVSRISFKDTYLYCAAIIGIVYAVSYYRKFKERELKASQLEAKLSEANLQMLKMQIHPHFLFNSLHAISTLIHKDPYAAEKMIAHLSDLLRMTLDDQSKQEISLQQEMEFLKPYLAIEQTRFCDKLHFELDIPQDTLSAQVPSFILQPLVENSVKHGITPGTTKGVVRIQAKKLNGELNVEILDNGKGFDQTTFQEGIGISNTRERLKKLYGEKHTFKIRNRADGGVMVSLGIPYTLETPETESDA